MFRSVKLQEHKKWGGNGNSRLYNDLKKITAGSWGKGRGGAGGREADLNEGLRLWCRYSTGGQGGGARVWSGERLHWIAQGL